MRRLKTTDPTTYRFSAQHMDHLDVLVKLLERTHGDLPAAEVARMVESMRRLRAEVAAAAERPAVK